ncbi:hypothetical protein LTR85_004938 [Meristemomyces frigidus]|nr:hypothetical protein LTR85_004938 [Meristemomyces frigidus]
MSNDGLVDRYKRYKAGTTTLVTWLSNTARQRRDVSEILPSLRTAKNASKQAKKKNSGIRVADTTVSVSTASLVKLAEIVAETVKDITREMNAIPKDVITGRQACAVWYAGLDEVNSPETELANSGHQHFIHVLRQVTSILDCALNIHAPARKQPAQKLSASATKAEDELTNVFSYLEIEQPTSAPLGTTPASSRPSLPKIRFELEST